MPLLFDLDEREINNRYSALWFRSIYQFHLAGFESQRSTI